MQILFYLLQVCLTVALCWWSYRMGMAHERLNQQEREIAHGREELGKLIDQANKEKQELYEAWSRMSASPSPESPLPPSVWLS